MAKERKVVYLDDSSLEQLDQMSGSERGDESRTVADALDLLHKVKMGETVLVELHDEEIRKQFQRVIDANDMSPADAIRRAIRRDFYELTDKGVNQRNLLRHVYVLVRIVVFLVIEMAKQHNIKFDPTPQEQIALRNGLGVELDRNRKE